MGGYRRRCGLAAADQDAIPLGRVIDTLSTRWGVLTIEAIDRGHTRFNELRRGIAGISHKVLIDTLRAMQRDGFVAGPLTEPDTTEYQLTELGRDLVDLIGQLRTWSEGRSEQIIRAQAEFDQRSAERRRQSDAQADSGVGGSISGRRSLGRLPWSEPIW